MTSLWITFLFFLLPLHVQARVDEPRGCWERQEYPCAFRSPQAEWISRGEVRLRTGTGTSLVWSGPAQLQILEGDLWIETNKTLKLAQAGHGFLISGEAWMRKTAEKLQLRQFKGESLVEGGVKGEVLPAGFENWWELAAHGVLRPFGSKKTLAEWNRWMNLSSEDAILRIQEYRKAWEGRVDVSSDLYAAIVQNRLDAKEHSEDQKFERQQADHRQNKRLRQMFRERYYQP